MPCRIRLTHPLIANKLFHSPRGEHTRHQRGPRVYPLVPRPIVLLLILHLQALIEAAGASVPIEEGVVFHATLLFILLSTAYGIEHPGGCKDIVHFVRKIILTKRCCYFLHKNAHTHNSMSTKAGCRLQGDSSGYAPWMG